MLAGEPSPQPAGEADPATPARLTTERVVVEMIHAIPMTYSRYLDFRGWKRQIGEEGNVHGYLVQRLEDGESNLLGPRAYLTWIPERQFLLEQGRYIRMREVLTTG